MIGLQIFHKIINNLLIIHFALLSVSLFSIILANCIWGILILSRSSLRNLAIAQLAHRIIIPHWCGRRFLSLLFIKLLIICWRNCFVGLLQIMVIYFLFKLRKFLINCFYLTSLFLIIFMLFVIIFTLFILLLLFNNRFIL